MFDEIVAREHTLDERLRQHRPRTPPAAALVAAAAAWSAAVWDAARDLPSPTWGDGAIGEGLARARRPVFICGVHRSGTTLVRDLLDGHPALTVLPSEGTFWTNHRTQLARQPADQQRRWYATEWIRRLANPTNQAPFWLLGRSTADASPYAAFGRALDTWWDVTERALGPAISSKPLVAVALAYAATATHPGSGRASARWVEKTPGNERFAGELRREFPEAAFVHVVRHPAAVMASRKRLELLATGAFARRLRVVEQLARSYRLALRHGTGPDGCYCVVRYEDLLADPQAVMTRVAAALGIEPDPILLRPTVAGLPSTTNSSFVTATAAGEIAGDLAAASSAEMLTRAERVLVGARVGRLARRLGYRLGG